MTSVVEPKEQKNSHVTSEVEKKAAENVSSQVNNKKQPPKTSGEKWYDVINFTVGKVCIIAATAAIAYVAAYGKEKYGPVPNVLKKLQNSINKLRGPWAENAEKLATAVREHKPGFKPIDSTKADFKAIFGGSLSGAVILWWGGAAFAPIMKVMENNKERISNYINKRFGKPGEVEIAHERLKDLPKQNWMDVFKGRIAAFCFAFTAFSTACFAFGRVKTPNDKGKYLLKFDWYEEKVGRLIAGLTKEGKAIAATPMSKELTKKQITNPSYRLGKIIAIDFYATSLAIFVWNFFSRRSARKRAAEVSNVIYEAAEAIAAPDELHFNPTTPEQPNITLPAPKKHSSAFAKTNLHTQAVQEQHDAPALEMAR